MPEKTLINKPITENDVFIRRQRRKNIESDTLHSFHVFVRREALERVVGIIKQKIETTTAKKRWAAKLNRIEYLLDKKKGKWVYTGWLDGTLTTGLQVNSDFGSNLHPESPVLHMTSIFPAGFVRNALKGFGLGVSTRYRLVNWAKKRETIEYLAGKPGNPVRPFFKKLKPFPGTEYVYRNKKTQGYVLKINKE